MCNSRERGIALLTTILVLMLMSALLVGFTTVVISDQRYRFIDRDRGQAFYAASGGIEKLTGDLGNLFLTNVAPTAAQVTALTAPSKQPSIAGITYTMTNTPAALPASLLTTYYCSAAGKTLVIVGTNGYTIRFCANAAGNPTISDLPLPIKAGPYEGLVALQTPYQLDVTAQSSTGGEVHLARTIEAVAIPVFQFGMFSDVDLSFFAAEGFGFGGRVHTNGNLWLAEGWSQTLTTTGKVTAVKDVIRQYLSNGSSIDTVGMIGTISMATAAGAPVANRVLDRTEGSVVGMPGSANYGSWQTVSLGATPTDYNGYLRNHSTGAKVLKLPLTATGVGGVNQDLIRRPLIGDSSASILYNERLFSKASIRILLSDTAADITGLPTVTPTAPVNLEGNWNTAPPPPINGTAYGLAGAGVSGVNGNPPIALSPGGQLTTTTAAVAAGATSISAAIPAYFNMPPTMTVGTGARTVNNVVCTGRTFTTFTNCNPMPPAVNPVFIGDPVTATINGQTVSTTVSVAWASPVNTITVPGGGTGPFAQGVFWLAQNAGAGQPMLVSCAGLQTAAPQFQNCAGVTSNAPSGAAITTSALSNSGIGTTGGYIKIEMANAAGAWTDVTMEVLNYGIGAQNLGGQICAEPNPNAIIRLERFKDNAGGTPTTNGGGCNYGTDTAGYRNPMNWWPMALFDTREGVQRDADPGTGSTGLPLGGVMYYVTIDTKNLAKWFKAAGAPYNVLSTGLNARIDNTGYTVYFSDRRNNRDLTSLETGEFGWEDFVNPGVAGGVPNGICDLPGEDVNGNGTCETYGKTPNYNGTYNAAVPGSVIPLTTAATPITLLTRGQAQVNRPIIFRRALKLINGGTLGSDAVVANRIAGLTVVSENPVYIQGDWNAASTFLVADLHASTAIIADAVTILSNQWNDNNSFASPYVGTGRLRTAPSYYRVAVLAGKGPSFPLPSDITGGSVFGTDGGAHNFLRMLEGGNGTGGITVNYRGSLATLSYSRQAIGTFKCCSGTAQDGIVYSVPVRNFIFDTDFLNPALLPPNTPVFRDMNAVGFSQELRPGK
jgi:hypothetical protein